MESHHRSFVAGILLIIVGFLFLANNLGWFYFSWETFWPYFLILAGVLFWLQWAFNRENYGVLMPGTICLVYGALFLYSAHFGWNRMGELWPVFILGPGLGFYAMYFLGRKDSGLVTTGTILTGIALVFLLVQNRGDFLWPLLLIAVGLGLLLKARFSQSLKPGAPGQDDSQNLDASE